MEAGPIHRKEHEGPHEALHINGPNLLVSFTLNIKLFGRILDGLAIKYTQRNPLMHVK